MEKRCAFCGQYFVPDIRVGERQKAWGSELCKRKRKQEAQRRWSDNNPGYFKGRYDYVKEWRQRRKGCLRLCDKMIQDEIILRRLDGSTFAAYG